METMKNIKKPAYALELGTGFFAAGYECPRCGYDTYEFDIGTGCYECWKCGYRSKSQYPSDDDRSDDYHVETVIFRCDKCFKVRKVTAPENKIKKPAPGKCPQGGPHVWISIMPGSC